MKRLYSLLYFMFLFVAALAQPLGPFGDVIFNEEPFVAPPPTPLTSIPWDICDHLLYDSAYTIPISINENGTATNKHIIVKGNSIASYGYGMKPYLNYVFTDIYDLKSISFILDPVRMNFHSFSEAGFLFNGDFTKIGGKTYYSGYAVILKCANNEGMQESDKNAPNFATLGLYYLNNEEWNTENFTPGSTTTTRTLISLFQTNIENFYSFPYNFYVEVSPSTRAFNVYINSVLMASVSATQVVGGASGPKGFGFYNGHYLHNCAVLTEIHFEHIIIDAEVNPLLANSEVFFLISGTTTEIRVLETKTGNIGQNYKIVQPRSIKYNGQTYLLTSNTRNTSINDDIELIYRPNSNNNKTTLYYILISGEELAGTPPEKTARVDGGEWANGSVSDRIPTPAGSEIEYNITAYAAPQQGVFMLRQGTVGSGTTTGWWGNPTSIPRSGIEKVIFLDLADIPNYIDDWSLGVWDGKTIVSIWDVTEQDLSVNPDRDSKKVTAWITNGSASGKYTLYVGGVGGVYLSAATTTNNQFYGFTGLTSQNSFDFSALHTDLAVDISQMFYVCTSLTSINVSSFNTSNVKTMNNMFTNCYSLISLNLSNFNTENVTNIGSMFSGCSSLTTVDMSSFNTKNVTEMPSLFTGCSSLRSTLSQPLNLNHFDMSKVKNTSSMFSQCNNTNFTYLNLGWWNYGTTTADPLYLASMFNGATNLTELHIENVDFSNTPAASSAFAPGCFNMFLLRNTNIRVYASDLTRTWLTTKPVVSYSAGTALTTTQAVLSNTPTPSTQPQPVDWHIAYTGTLGSSGGSDGYVEIRDEVPAGLTINTGSITGTESSMPIANTITWEIDNGTIIWSVPTDMLPTTVSFKVTVDGGLAPNTFFDNTATVAGTNTNTTYHEYLDACKFIEQFFLYENGVTTTKIAPDLENYIMNSTNHYTVNGNSDLEFLYIFVGYKVGSGLVPADSIPQVTTAINPISGCDTIKLYYKKIYINIYYVTDNNVFLKAVTELMTPHTNYYLPPNSFNSFTVGGTTYYYYYDYAKNGDESVKNIIYTSAGSAPPVGLLPLYPDGSMPTFEYNTAPYNYPINTDMDITLYVTTKQAVKVNFVELNNPMNILHNPEYYFLTMPFDPALLERIEEVALDTDIDLRDEMGKLYQYANTYSINGGAQQTGFPPEQNNPCELTLYFNTVYLIIEKFHTDGNSQSAKELMADISGYYSGGETFEGTPPLAIHDGDSVWVYIGYKVGNDENPLIEYDPSNPEFPFVDNVNEDLVIIYVYEKQAESTDITIIERWREYNNTGNILAPDETLIIPKGSAYTDHIKDFSPEWIYVGWMLDGDETLRNGNPSEVLTNIMSTHTITYCYEVCTTPTIIIDNTSEEVCGLETVTITGSFSGTDVIKVQTLNSHGKKAWITVDKNTHTFTVIYNPTIANVGNTIEIVLTATGSSTTCPGTTESVFITVKAKPRVRFKGECVE